MLFTNILGLLHTVRKNLHNVGRSRFQSYIYKAMLQHE